MDVDGGTGAKHLISFTFPLVTCGYLQANNDGAIARCRIYIRNPR